jgi:predicted GNAT family N-acyltransferase
MLRVKLIETETEQAQAFQIRHTVFVVEQNVPEDLELDEYESVSRHFLALNEGGQPCGAARWRFTDKGIKLERFAVLPAYRGKGAGVALVEGVLADIEAHLERKDKLIYLNAQKSAKDFYIRFGFQVIGDEFWEAGIPHYTMEYKQ